MKKINVHKIILILGLVYYLLEVFLFKWLFFDYSIKFCSIIILGLLVITNMKRGTEGFKIDLRGGMIYYIFIVYILLNWIFTEKHTYIYSELVYYTLTPIAILLFFKIFTKEKQIYNKWFKKIIPNLLNIYFFINIPILILQAKGTGFLMRGFSASYSNQFYTDHIAGLLGLDGTHKLTLYTLATIISNVYMILKYKEKKYIIFLILELIFSIYISQYNDNKALYFLLPIMLFPCIIYLFKYVNKRNKSTKPLLIIIIMVITIIVMYMLNGNIRNEFDAFLGSLFNEKTISNVINQERILLFKYALENGNGYKMGMGIGSIKLFSDPSLPNHFGISDLSSRTYEGGIIYVLLWILVFSEIIYTAICSEKRDVKTKILIILSVTIFFIYEQISTEWNQVFLIGLMYMMYKNIYEFVKEIDTGD